MRQMHAKQCSFERLPAMIPTASPKSIWAWPGGWANGTNLPPSSPHPTDIILHSRVAAGEAVLVAKPLPDPPGRMPLLRRRRIVGLDIASITPINGPSFGRPTGFVRT